MQCCAVLFFLYTIPMLQRVREWLVLVLIVLLPFHAFLVTVGTRLLVGPGHAPLPWFAGWKEMLLVVVLVVVILEIIYSLLAVPRTELCSGAGVPRYPLFFDVLDWLILGMLVLGMAVSIFNFLYGFKYTLFPLFLFLVLRRVRWSERFLLLTSYFLLPVGAVVAGYGILTLFLPEFFFTWLGYSDLHSLYLPDGPIAAFQKIEGTSIRRIQSTFSGPNQLGVWLLIPFSVAIVECIRRKLVGYWVIGLLGAALLLTFSRAAWIGAAVILLMSVWLYVPNMRKLLGYWVIGLLGVVVVGAVAFPEIFLREVSTSGHWRRPMEAVRLIAAHPWGLGLGSAGPAQNRLSDSCVFLAEGADTSWAKDRPNLCVFLGDQQVQPVGRTCTCPLLPENWYLQVGVELGVLGMMLFVTLVVLLIFRLLPTSYFLLPFVGVSVAALFLHAWEDSAVSYTVWVLLASAIPVRHRILR